MNEKKTAKLETRILIGTIWIVVGACVLYFGVRAVCNLYVWSGEEPLYLPLKLCQHYAPYAVSIFYLIWVSIVLYRDHRKSRKRNDYLAEVLAATKNLYNDSDEPIELSPELENAQMQLNNVKMTLRERERLAKEAEQRKNDLVVYLAHDLKTPLTSVIGYLTLLHDEKEISPQLREKYEGIALDKALRLEYLINEFFEITRFNLMNLTLDVSEVNLTLMLEQILFEFEPIFAEKQIRGRLQADEKIMLKCDAAKLERVFENLLRNAYNYGYANSEILIELKKEEGQVRICVTNHGNTIPPEKLERIFEQFYRLDSARTSGGGGSGLGLAIAKEIVELHHGSICARSEDEKIHFEVVLPTTGNTVD